LLRNSQDTQRLSGKPAKNSSVANYSLARKRAQRGQELHCFAIRRPRLRCACEAAEAADDNVLLCLQT
jgi:hypothetical protein